MSLTIKQIKNNDHIHTETIQKDIRDTEIDIARWKREIQGYELLKDRLSQMRADARKEWLKEGEFFIENLRDILKYRQKG